MSGFPGGLPRDPGAGEEPAAGAGGPTGERPVPQPMEGGPPPAPPPDEGEDYVIGIRGVRAVQGAEPGQLDVTIETTRGELTAYLHPVEGKTGTLLCIGGAAGGVDGPADRVYTRLAEALVPAGVTTLRLRYRQPGDFTECVLDTLAACSFLKGIGAASCVLVGHSFGGAVAIKAGELAPLVQAVVAMSSQRYGTQGVERLGKPLLLLHGGDDTVLLPEASQDIFDRAQEPKRLVVLEGAGHGLAEVADDVFKILADYVTRAVGDAAAG